MKLKALLLFFTFQLTVTGIASAQTNELSGWAAWFHTQKFNNHWGRHLMGSSARRIMGHI